MKLNQYLLFSFLIVSLTGCYFGGSSRDHFDPELEKRERDLMIRRDFYSGEERRLMDKDLDRIQNNYTFTAPEDAIEILLFGFGTPRPTQNKTIDQKIDESLKRAFENSQKKQLSPEK